ncbi:MAG: ABC transporter permease [Tissierellia bacterium]|nr:ABC transporter permease [Tissierellia bacterium]
MKIKDIAKTGLKGRQKDTLLIKIVIILAFVFIVVSTTFQASVDKTKAEQQFDLYGSWHAAYLDGDKDTLERLQKEEDIDKIGLSNMLGYSDKVGLVGTFNEELLEMGRFSLYKGRYPEKDNEIMIELQQMSNMGMELEIGQKVSVDIVIETVFEDTGPYIMELNKKFYEEGIYPDYLQHHETPFEKVGDTTIVVSNDYLFYYPQGGDSDPDLIRETGLLTNQKVILKREFEIVGIIQNYTDKWDLDGYPSPNAFITEEAGDLYLDVFYNNNIEDFSEFKMENYNIFLESNSLEGDLYSKLKDNYPNRISDIEYDEYSGLHFWFWMDLYGATDEEIEEALEGVKTWAVEREPEDWEDKSLEGDEVVESKVEVNTANFRRNTFSYPDIVGTTEHYLASVIIAVIFIATTLAIFQIFLTQMKRRSRKIVLLKSIGATKNQIIQMLFYEGIYFLKYGLLIGLPVGFGVAAGIIFGLNKFGGRNLQFYVYPQLFLLGLIAGILALFVGMAIPTIYAVNIPLVGTMEKPPKHKKSKTKKDVEIRRKSFSDFNWDYLKLNKNKALISFGISFIAITILLATIMLDYFAFNNYREIVVKNSRPDYVMEAIFGEREREFPVIQRELKEFDGIKSTEMYKVGKQTFLWYDGIEENKILNTYEGLLPTELLKGHFSKYNGALENEEEYLKNAFYTKTFAIDAKDENSKQFNKFRSMINEGKIDKKAFINGEEIILMIPMYCPGNENVEISPFPKKKVVDATNEDNRMKWLFETSGVYEISYNSRYKNYYKRQDYIKPGDNIYLSADLEAMSGETYASGYVGKEFKVGGIIHYLPKEGLWPFSNNVAPYVVISSIDAMESLYPRSMYGLGQYGNVEYLEWMVQLIYPYSYGRTLCYINTDSKQTDVILDAKLLTYAINRGYNLYNYKESNSRIYYEAFNNALIISLLGITAAAIALIILYNTMVSKMEQDRNRIGILQSMGVTKEEFSHYYIKIGIIVGLLSIILIHLILFLILFFTSMGDLSGFSVGFSGYIEDIFVYKLMDYPWILHLVVCIIYFIITILIYYMPSRSITSKYPVENIRSLSR